MKKCKICKTKFEPKNKMASVCGFDCALKLVEEKKIKTEQKKINKKLTELKTKSDIIAEVQKIFNSYIRARDFGKPCISCGNNLSYNAIGGGYDCGHYRSVGSAPHLRFFEDNAHAQCKKCNRYLSGNHVSYRFGLIERIGIDRVEALEANQDLVKYSKDDLLELKKIYKEKIKLLKKD